VFTFFFRLGLWLIVLLGATFFWVAVFDSGETGLAASLERNSSHLAGFILNRNPLR